MDFLESIPDSLLKERMIALRSVYEEADEAVSVFSQSVDFGCAFACGTCCQGFIPDVLPIEAAYIAAFAISQDEDKAKTWCLTQLEPITGLSEKPSCPLYEPASAFHCSTYEARPLVCRMFGFSGDSDKHDQLVFSLCRAMKGTSTTQQTRKFYALQEDARFLVKPPLMSYFGNKILAIDPDRVGSRKLLHLAVPEAAQLIFYLRTMNEEVN